MVGCGLWVCPELIGKTRRARKLKICTQGYFWLQQEQSIGFLSEILGFDVIREVSME